METKRIIAGMLVAIMIVSGLSYVNVVSGSDEPEPTQKATVPRTVLFEDFTNWGCGPCAAYGPWMKAAMANYNYTQLAPVFYHWYYPAADDPLDDYMEAEQDPTEVEVYYGRQNGDNNYVPNTYLDGIDIVEYYPWSQITTDGLVENITNRLAIPANMSITTSGTLNSTALTGEINIHVEIEETIANPSDMRLFAQLWENNITRPFYGTYPYPNTETEMVWACWDMILSEDGYDVSSLDQIGEYLDLSVPFNIESDWIANEIGVTVFVSHTTANTILTEQAAVQIFNNAPPIVSLTAPSPTTAEQVLSGTIPITWTAMDVEDAQETLDITVDYSADGGFSWTNIFAGIDNNDPPYTYNWNTVSAGIPDGTGYKLRVRATDSGGVKSLYATSSESFSIDNTLNDEWYFQVENTGTFKDLTMKPVENTVNLAATASLSAVGEYQIGAWQTVLTYTGSNIDGSWTFKTYGKTPNPGLVTLQANLYAKIFTSSNLVTPIAVTGYDDENVGAFTTTHLFTWASTLSGTIVNGDTIVIQIWLHVTGGPYTQNSGATTNPDFTTTATPWTYYDWEDSGPGTATGSWVGAGGNPGGFVQIALVSESTGPGTTAYPYSGYYQQSFTTSFVPFTATLELDWKVIAANTVDPLTQYFTAYVETTTGIPTTSPVWSMESVATAPTSWISVDIDVSKVVTAATTYYVKIAYRHDSLQKGDGTYTGGFDNVLLSFSRPYSIFYMEYDYGTAKSSIVPTINSGPTLDPYEISLTGKTANSWVFISFPSGVTGNIQDLLTDGGATGDGLTTWSVAKWYNPLTPADPWKTYRVGGTANDMPSITNGMGFWIYITANGGDQMLTLSSYAATPASTLITLYAGWNLVGYPSATDRLGSTLPSQVDMLSVYSASAVYTDYVNAAIDPVTLHHGNAYFMHCSAGTTWTVTNP